MIRPNPSILASVAELSAAKLTREQIAEFVEAPIGEVDAALSEIEKQRGAKAAAKREKFDPEKISRATAEELVRHSSDAILTIATLMSGAESEGIRARCAMFIIDKLTTLQDRNGGDMKIAMQFNAILGEVQNAYSKAMTGFVETMADKNVKASPPMASVLTIQTEQINSEISNGEKIHSSNEVPGPKNGES